MRNGLAGRLAISLAQPHSQVIDFGSVALAQFVFVNELGKPQCVFYVPQMALWPKSFGKKIERLTGIFPQFGDRFWQHAKHFMAALSDESLCLLIELAKVQVFQDPGVFFS